MALLLGIAPASPLTPRLKRSPIRRPAPALAADRIASRSASVRCEALGEGIRDRTVYEGVYGPWTVDPSDVREVISYRSGLVTAATSFVIGASAAFLPEGTLGDIIKQDVDLFYVVGAAGLGLSLVLIHIYVTPIKRFLQALWAIGVVGSIGAYRFGALPSNQTLVQYVLDNPSALWLVGPLFAALTGLVFKEVLSEYRKLRNNEILFIWLGCILLHGFSISWLVRNVQSGLMDNGAKLSLLGLWMALFVVFAARKFQQPIKDDIGDKSIFMFNALPEEEKKALLQKLEERSNQKLD